MWRLARWNKRLPLLRVVPSSAPEADGQVALLERLARAGHLRAPRRLLWVLPAAVLGGGGDADVLGPCKRNHARPFQFVGAVRMDPRDGLAH
eukprot:5460246-Prymnesium_polylepis.1